MRGQLMDAVWGGDWVGDDHVIVVHLANLRRKLGESATSQGYIRTVRGFGYRFEPAPADAPRAGPGLTAPTCHPPTRRPASHCRSATSAWAVAATTSSTRSASGTAGAAPAAASSAALRADRVSEAEEGARRLAGCGPP